MDLLTYVAALLAHPAYTARFQAELIRPGLYVHRRPGPTDQLVRR